MSASSSTIKIFWAMCGTKFSRSIGRGGARFNSVSTKICLGRLIAGRGVSRVSYETKLNLVPSLDSAPPTAIRPGRRDWPPVFAGLALLLLLARPGAAQPGGDKLLQRPWFEARSAHFQTYSCGVTQDVAR